MRTRTLLPLTVDVYHRCNMGLKWLISAPRVAKVQSEFLPLVWTRKIAKRRYRHTCQLLHLIESSPAVLCVVRQLYLYTVPIWLHLRMPPEHTSRSRDWRRCHNILLPLAQVPSDLDSIFVRHRLNFSGEDKKNLERLPFTSLALDLRSHGRMLKLAEFRRLRGSS